MPLRTDIKVIAECRQLIEDERPTWSRISFDRDGFTRLAITILLVAFVTGLFIVLSVIKIAGFFILLKRNVHNRYLKWRTDRQLMRETAIVPQPTKSRAVKRDLEPRGTNTSLYFTRLPVEIRRRILIDVFGNKTLHMDLRLRKSVHPVVGKDESLWFDRADRNVPVTWDHAGILRAKSDSTDYTLKWRWFSCVCHRFPAWGPDVLSHGRRCNFPAYKWRDPEGDLCLKGGGVCNEWPINESCLIGIMGYMTSCRQAYIEAVEILYRLNTISISSHILLRAAQDLLAPPVVASITSLELVWDISKVPLEEGFTGLKGPNSEGQSRTEPIFSSLKFLRISFAAKKEKENWDANDPVTGLPYNAAESLKLEHLQKHTLPAIDRLLERMAPPEADVIFSCRGWGWYEALGTALLEKQGKKVTKSQNCELGGDKCWRVTPEATLAGEGESGGESEAGAGDRELEEGKGTAQGARREGFWIHRPPLTHWTSRPLVWPLFP